VKRETDGTVGWKAGFAVSAEYLDVDILIESSGQAIARSWKHAPSAASRRSVNDRRIVRGVAESKDWKRFEGPVEEDGSVRRPTAGRECHVQWETAATKLTRQGAKSESSRTSSRVRNAGESST
jgi:hypothetical protein